MGKFIFRAWGLASALSVGALAHAEPPQFIFENLSKCQTDAEYAKSCAWFSEKPGDWSASDKALVTEALKAADSKLPKARQFFATLKSMGLKKVHFVRLTTGIDYAATVQTGEEPYIVFEPAFFASGVQFDGISAQEHTVLHELFHVWAGYLSIDDYFADPLWKNLSSALEWTYAAGHTTMVDSKALNAQAAQYTTLMHTHQWDAATAIDMGFSRPLGFPSFYSMTMISEYLPELGSFLLHDSKMQRDVPTPVVKFLREATNLGFLIDGDVSDIPGPLGPRGQVNSAGTEFVGMLFQEDDFICTAFLIRDGVVGTAKHCIGADWTPLRALMGRKSFNYLSLVFIKADGSRVRVDGSNITAVNRDGGVDDLAYLMYDPAQTIGKIQAPTLHYVNSSEQVTKPSAIFSVGYPLPQKVQRLQRMSTAPCALDGQFKPLPDYQGPLYGTTCPGWFGASGSPFLSAAANGSYNLYGVLTHTFDSRSDGKPLNPQSDSWGPFTSSNFSPIYLGRDFLTTEAPLTD